MIGPWARGSAALSRAARRSAGRRGASPRAWTVRVPSSRPSPSLPHCAAARALASNASAGAVAGARAPESSAIAPARTDLFSAPARALHATSPLGGPSTRERRRVAVVGGGFGGLYTALALDSLLWEEGKRPHITLITSDERFEFRPLLFDALLGAVSEASAAPRLSELLRGTGVRLRRGNVIEVLSDICPGPGDAGWKAAKERARRRRELGGEAADLESSGQPVPCSDSGGELALDDGSLVRYDWLVLATGLPRPVSAGRRVASDRGAGEEAGGASAAAATSAAPSPAAGRPLPSVPGSSTLALRFRSHADLAPAKAALARAAAAAARRPPGDPSTPPRLVVVGGGPSGVELAAAAGQLSGGAAVTLVCDGRPLAGMPEGLRLAAERALEAAGVEVLPGLRVQGIRRREGPNDAQDGEGELVVSALPAGARPVAGSPPPPPLELDALAVFWCAGEVADPTAPRPKRAGARGAARGAGTSAAPDGSPFAAAAASPPPVANAIGVEGARGGRKGFASPAAADELSDSEDVLSSDATAYDLYGPPPPGAWDDGVAAASPGWDDDAVAASASASASPVTAASAFPCPPAPPRILHPFRTDARGRLEVTSALSSPDCSRTFAVGDAAGEAPGGADRWAEAAGSPHPGGTPSAQRAMQEARLVAENVWKAVHAEDADADGLEGALGSAREEPPPPPSAFVYAHLGDMLSLGYNSGAVTPAAPVPRFLAESAARGSPLWRALELAGASVSGGAAGDAARKSYERTDYGADAAHEAVVDVSGMTDADLDALWARPVGGPAGARAERAAADADGRPPRPAEPSSTSDRVAQLTLAGPLGAAARRAAYVIRQPTPGQRVRVATDLARSAGEAAARNVGAFVGALARVASGRSRR